MKNFSNFKRIIILFILLIIFITISAISYTNAVCSDISNSVFRLHVIANSDTNEDQSLKYIVRDKVLEYINSISQGKSSKQEIINLAKENINQIQIIAENTVLENGYNYPIKVNIGNFEFPTKTYGDISFPAGFYDALKIEIGEAKGQNWWCVMFPPLCFIDVSSGIVPEESKQIMEDNLSEEDYRVLSENTSDIKIKFKIIELLQKINITLAQN